MLIVALTGGIASGKSVVAKVLSNLGCYAHNADKTAHKLMEPKKPVWKKIVSHFGEKILNSDETINRAYLGSIAFTDEKERRFLNELIHPLVFSEKKETINTIKKKGAHKIFVSEAALTIEAGYAEFYDKIVLVHCKKDIQIKRLMERDQITQKEAQRKIESQMQPEEKFKYASYTIDSSGTLKDTIEQTEQVFRYLMMDYEMKKKNLKA